MLRKMYLVSPDYLNTVTSKNTPPPPPQSASRRRLAKNDYGLQKIKTTKKKKYLSQREHDRWVAKRSAVRRGRDYDKWFKVRGTLHEADVEIKRQIKAVADFLK